MFGGGLSYWPGFFSQDMMRASAYRYVDIPTKLNKPQLLSLLIVDRKKTRSFIDGKKWIRIKKLREPNLVTIFVGIALALKFMQRLLALFLESVHFVLVIRKHFLQKAGPTFL